MRACITKMRTLLLLSLGSLCFAGQGIVLGSGQYVYNNSILALPSGTPYRIEESLQNMSCGYHVFNPGIVGANIYPLCINSTSQILMVCPGDNNGNCFQIETFRPAGGFVTFRLQHLPSSLTDVCQAWDVNGNQIANATVSYSKEFAYANGVSVGDGNGAGYVINYARIYAATVGVNSRPPVTADTTAGLVFEWKFDGNLNDSGPGGYTGVLTSGSASYVTTLGQSLAVPLVANADVSPSWPASIPGYQPSMRAGQPASLSCANSYSQSDNPSVSCFWQVLLQPGQAPPFWNDQRSQTPTLTGRGGQPFPRHQPPSKDRQVSGRQPSGRPPRPVFAT